MTERITAAEVLGGGPTPTCYEDLCANGQTVPVWWLRRLAAQMETDERRLAAAEADAAQWRALQAVIEHPERGAGHNPFLSRFTGVSVVLRDGNLLTAPTPVELLAKLDARTPQPKPERWRWMHDDGRVLGVEFASDRQARAWRQRWPTVGFEGGTLYRELRNPAGDVLYIREGRPVPAEGGPWE